MFFKLLNSEERAILNKERRIKKLRKKQQSLMSKRTALNEEQKAVVKELDYLCCAKPHEIKG